MSDIPADIRAAAVTVVDRGYDTGLIDAVAAALMAEREACALIVESEAKLQSEGWRLNPREGGCGGYIAAHNTGKFAAERIRTPSTGEER